MALIKCKQLTKHYYRGSEQITPLRNLDLEIEKGKFVALMGPSGSGKTTLLNLLAGIDRPSEGELLIDGAPMHTLGRNALAQWRADHIGYIFQLYNLIPVLTAYENVELPLLLHNVSRNERHRKVSRALDVVGISDRHNHYPRQLSGGQEQRVAIARAIVTEPTILLADEPTGDLDRETGTAIMDLLQILQTEQGQTIVMVTHDPRTAEWANTLLHLEKGQLIEQVTT
ncbi:MAG: ABC transporter ATP-binding protein [Phycisphaerae bacterium]|jgi:putative ABC transport system ATP-binding protein|nr:ABC transporter ATP-binding protein [Phycisphaerae bacterium]MBT5409747.1 ABC transporter ATP-binding protein [Phycisphaerae bacterium]MBT6165629.1 ABC transporter ATP-binding protein [Phycisphaerae bacterium]MBT7657616.1 ABC transporter ATP-binding protein [Phycisphaerae bacterium]